MLTPRSGGIEPPHRPGRLVASFERVQVRRHVVCIAFGNTEVRHRATWMNALRIANPAHHAAPVIGEQSGARTAARDCRERRAHGRRGPHDAGDVVTRSATILAKRGSSTFPVSRHDPTLFRARLFRRSYPLRS